MEGELRETAIMAKAPEEVTMTEMTTAVCKVGSVLILKMYFMHMQDDKWAKKKVKNCACNELARKRKEPG
jgi:hypothetical protein